MIEQETGAQLARRRRRLGDNLNEEVQGAIQQLKLEQQERLESESHGGQGRQTETFLSEENHPFFVSQRDKEQRRLEATAWNWAEVTAGVSDSQAAYGDVRLRRAADQQHAEGDGAEPGSPCFKASLEGEIAKSAKAKTEPQSQEQPMRAKRNRKGKTNRGKSDLPQSAESSTHNREEKRNVGVGGDDNRPFRSQMGVSADILALLEPKKDEEEKY
jgi:hypothetical protein